MTEDTCCLPSDIAETWDKEIVRIRHRFAESPLFSDAALAELVAKNPDAVRYESVTFDECLTQDLKVMDSTAFTLCKDNNIPIIVFDINGEGNITKALAGGDIGTMIHKG